MYHGELVEKLIKSEKAKHKEMFGNNEHFYAYMVGVFKYIVASELDKKTIEKHIKQ